MEPLLNNGICRCCASEGSFKDFLTSYHWMGEEEVYADMLKDCFSISLSVSENYSNGGICEVCITHLRNACNFKRQVLQTEEHFKGQIQGILLKSNPIKIEPVRDEGEQSDHNMSDDFSANDYEMPLKMEKVDEKPKKRQAKASTSRTKKTKTADGEPSAKRDQKLTIPTNVERKDRKRKTIRITVEQKLNMVIVSEVEKHQNNIKEILLNTNATPIRCKGGIGYACCFCSEQFPDPKDLKAHTQESHNAEEKSTFMKGKDMHGYFVKLDITDVKCLICGETMENVDKVVNHLQMNHDKKLYTDIKDHILPFKFGNGPLNCIICSNVFNSFKALQEHMNVHYSNYSCLVCGAGFVNKNILLRHGDAHKIGTFTCEICSRTFDTDRKKRLHDRSRHAGIKLPHKCGYCMERFKEVWKKQEHLVKVHGVKSPGIKCQACDKSFESKHSWRLHIARVHLLQRPHKCQHCDMEFYAKKELESHMVKHTGSREFKCESCFKTYGRLKTLKEHVRKVHA